MNTFRYWLLEEGSVNDYYTIETNWDKDELEYIAEAAAEDFHDNHDGWDHKWPLEFVIADETGQLGIFKVYIEARPEFDAFPVKP